MANTYAFGCAEVTYKIGSTTGTFGFLDEENDVLITEEEEIIEHGAHGIDGPIAVMSGKNTMTATVPAYLDLDTLADIVPGKYVKTANGYSYKSVRGQKRQPVALCFKPLGANDDSENMVILKAYPKISSEIKYTEDGKSVVTLEFTCAPEDGVLAKFGGTLS